MGVPEDVVEGLDEVVDLVLTADQRRQELDDVDVVGRHLGENPVAVEERHDDQSARTVAGRTAPAP